MLSVYCPTELSISHPSFPNVFCLLSPIVLHLQALSNISKPVLSLPSLVSPSSRDSGHVLLHGPGHPGERGTAGPRPVHRRHGDVPLRAGLPPEPRGGAGLREEPLLEQPTAHLWRYGVAWRVVSRRASGLLTVRCCCCCLEPQVYSNHIFRPTARGTHGVNSRSTGSHFYVLSLWAVVLGCSPLRGLLDPARSSRRDGSDVLRMMSLILKWSVVTSLSTSSLCEPFVLNTHESAMIPRLGPLPAVVFIPKLK